MVPAQESTDTRPRFPVVGVGASAGGLAATTELLQNLGSEPGVAIVVVHHLDPEHPSSLAEILGRAAALPVHELGADTPLEPNHVYVVPSNAGLLIREGSLRLAARDEKAGLHLTVDQFFRSLAEDQGASAIGVVLSGSGSDGSEGLIAIRAAGGITFAQDESAEFRSMPERALATGSVDYSLPPAKIAQELVRIGQRALLPPVEEDGAFRRILLALRSDSGVDFTNYKHTTLKRRVQRRMSVHGLASELEYAELLERSADEVKRLFDEVLINVTSFFRDPETFEVLKAHVFPKLLENRPAESTLRVWVPACSSGEEVYSLAICLLEFLSDAGASEVELKLFGTDVSLPRISEARAGKYPASIEQSVSPGRLRRFFSKLESGYQIRKDVRDLCVFAEQDATRDPPFARLDLISCRNLMIYLGAPLQERLLPIFHYALKDPGFLLLGPAESVRSFPGFATVDAGNKIYARRAVASRHVFDFVDPEVRERPGPVPVARDVGSRDVQREADRLLLAEFAPPGVVITDDLGIVEFRGRTGLFLDPAPGAASFDLLRMVKEELRFPLRQAIDEARAQSTRVRSALLPLGSGADSRSVELEVIPFGLRSASQRFFLVLFEDVTPAERTSTERAMPPGAPEPNSRALHLEQELASTRDYLQSTIEQSEASNEELRAANEEITSSNEELRSTNEELQMAKEELQGMNEELRILNEEMAARNRESSRLSDDLNNVLSSAEIPLVLLGRDGCLRRFTPAARMLLHLSTADLGRPIGKLPPLLDERELLEMTSAVLERLSAQERTVECRDGRWFQLTVRPYLTLDSRVDGVVVVALDVSATQHASHQLEEARKYAEGVIDTVREGLVVIDRDLRVRTVNRAFSRILELAGKEIVGWQLHAIGDGDWLPVPIRQRLVTLGVDEELESQRLEYPSARLGPRVFRLNARRVANSASILVALEDVTSQEHAEGAGRRIEQAFRDMLSTSAEAIIMSDEAGQIVFANQAAVMTFGYSNPELLARKIESLVPERARAAHAAERARYLSAPTSRPMARGRDLTALRKDGTELPVEIRLAATSTVRGTLAASFIKDVTERKAAEQALRDYQKKLQSLALEAAVASERERRGLAIGLHDGLGQSLALARIKLNAARDSVADDGRPAFDTASELVVQSIAAARELMFDLSPPILYDLGLKEALSWFVEDFEKRYGIKVELCSDHADKPLDESTAALVFRAVRELLMNVAKHANTPTAKLALTRTGSDLRVELEDAGVGFNSNDRAASSGFGLFSVREQLSRLGGSVEIESAPSRGTRVVLRVPLRRDGAVTPDAAMVAS